MTRVTVVNPETRTSSSPSPGAEPAQSSRYLDLEASILRLVEQDPFASIQELKTVINNRPGGLRTTWWQVFGLLRRNKLLTRRSRFKYILGRR